MKIKLTKILGTDLGYLPIGTIIELPESMDYLKAGLGHALSEQYGERMQVAKQRPAKAKPKED